MSYGNMEVAAHSLLNMGGNQLFNYHPNIRLPPLNELYQTLGEHRIPFSFTFPDRYRCIKYYYLNLKE